MIKKQGKTILFKAVASLMAAAMVLSLSCILAFAAEETSGADDFVTWRNKGKQGENYVIGLTLQLGEYETFEESSTFQVGFSVTTKDKTPVPQEDCSFIFDKSLSETSGQAVVQDFRFVEDGKFRIILSGRKDTDESRGILNKEIPLPVGELHVAVGSQDVEITLLTEECEAVNEYGNIVPITDFGNLDSHVLKGDGQEENPEEPTTSPSTSTSAGSRRSRRVDSELNVHQGPIAAVETRGTWKQRPDGSWLFLDALGNPMTNTWIYVNGLFYHLGPDGVMQTGWFEENGQRYYLNANGAMTTSWQFVDNQWYFMEANGVMQTGWRQLQGKWYYLNPLRPVPQLVYDEATGVVLTDPATWAPITTTEGQMNYGALYQNTVTPDGYPVDENGAWVQ